ncbi:MAG: hypothetical protein LBC71_03500 [Oscillospiraceae bacterium]|jgi:uncharacterized membrane protein|nr:hypothetical protein [Oscillospiraceae bacterium]
MLLMNIIMAVCFFPIWPILFFMIRNTKESKKNIIIGVTLPPNTHKDPQVLAVIKSFTKWLNITMIPLFPLLAIPFFMTLMGAALTFYMVWLLLLIVFPMGTFAIHREKLMKLKRENNWYSEATEQVQSEVKATVVPTKKINNVWFFIPTVISLLPLIYSLTGTINWDVSAVYITFALMTALFWPFYYIIFRLRSEVLNENITLTTALTRVRRNNWGKFWLIATWATGLLNPFLLLFEENMTALLVLILGYTILLIALSIYTEFATRIAQQKLTQGETSDSYVDEDDYWIWGLFYLNKNDKHFFVNDRIGMNMSCNLAKPTGKVLMIFALLCLIAMPFFGIWMWIEEITPVRLVLTDTTLTARSTGLYTYTIKLSDINSVELVDEMPLILSRNDGFGSANLLKGRFTASHLGTVFLSVQQNDPPFLIIVAADRTYIVNDADSAKTREVYGKIGD